jgi:hypothetical protein
LPEDQKEAAEAPIESDLKDKTWNVLSDNYMLDAKLKDWGESEAEEEHDFECE